MARFLLLRRTFSSGHPQDGVALGTAALDWARRAANPRLTAFVQATTARGHARLGDNHTCLKLLEAAERELERVDPDEPVPLWLTVFDRAALEGHRGSCLLDLTRLFPVAFVEDVGVVDGEDVGGMKNPAGRVPGGVLVTRVMWWSSF